MNARVFIARDAAAIAVGADDVAAALAAAAERRGIAVDIVRTGSRGLYWLEPTIEVATPAGRIAYGPVTVADIDALLDAGLLDGKGGHPLALGLAEDIPWLKRQTRLTFSRSGIIDQSSLADYRAHSGYKGLERALSIGTEATLAEVEASGLRGRGGAGFPTGRKWRTVAVTPSPKKYIVCNADEGDSGTFSDRMVMEDDPFVLIEGMTIAALAVGATEGYIYLRSEYPHAEAALKATIATAYAEGYLGDDILGSGQRFHLHLRRGAGAYVCGEETSLLESLEGKRGEVRPKPPLPAIEGLFGMPTVINNVISLASVPIILDKGGAYYRDFGMGRSLGTLPIQLTGNIARGGLIEKAFGVTLRELLYDYGGGSASGRPIRAVQVGGPLGAYLPEAQFDTPLDYEAFAALGAVLGHGGIVVFDDSVDMADMARYAMEFCAIESCGKCTPCRIGSTRGEELLEQIIVARSEGPQPGRIELLKSLCDTMLGASLCALGGMTPYPVLSAINHFPEDFGVSKDSAEAR
ncbi:formate dehydrogenase beta subunit [Pseudomonas sp.]|uniref:formate dehydrogenase beta subunit n=1 Tax=Pseudomonas sp. TaxID=306 RepID=UPI002D104E23|nr:NADH-ubiquinone oxidoreductase-F iron-sulfur binding region domain-containing protein [Pseudomonas sp.]HUE92740.1 NADH-ubiquinone oxidoreductase-F iron-sulfur binding region domain-containing protein [Pseudomonas sp.]